MMNAKEALHAFDYAVGYALMRALFRDVLQAVPAPVLARQLGVRVATLERFMAGGEPGKRLWEAGAKLAGEHEAPEMAPEEIALNFLADLFPLDERVRVRGVLAGALRPVLEALGGTANGHR